MSDEVGCRVHVLACLIVIVEEGVTLLDVAFGVKKYGSFAVYLTSHSADVLLLCLGADLAVVDAVEEAGYIRPNVRNHNKT